AGDEHADGAAGAAGLRRAGHDAVYRGDPVRRVPPAGVRPAAAAAADGPRRLVRPQERPRLLQLCGGRAAAVLSARVGYSTIQGGTAASPWTANGTSSRVGPGCPSASRS